MSKDLLINLGVAIQKKSKAKFKTNIDFAIACDVDEKTIRRIYKGQQNISIKILQKISFALDTRMSELLEEIE